jgi:hypothetical protein
VSQVQADASAAATAPKRLSDIQPQYFPRLHYLARMLASDVFVIRDDVQFVRNHKYPDGSRGPSYQAHTPIKGNNGPALLAVNLKKGNLQRIHEVELSYDQDWTSKHLNIIRNSYGKAPCFKTIYPELETLLSSRTPRLGDLNVATTCWALGRVLGADDFATDPSVDHLNELLARRPEVRLRKLLLGTRTVDPASEASPSGNIVGLCRGERATKYLAGGTAARAYLEIGEFDREGIEVELQNWACEPYHQLFPKSGFVANLSIIDLLMNVDAPEALAHLSERPS